LEEELGKVKGTLLVESDKHDSLCIAIGLVFDDLGLAPVQGTSSLMVWAI
jgi:hypothetical protein